MEDLGIETPFGTREPIQSNPEQFCLECGITINKENDSGWECFRPGGFITQKICKKCDSKNNKGEKVSG
jgi:hypothetical protein